ncbi:MAG: 4Fe-4S binding protein [Coriobacteriia bacterium]|nr:4Fe-4S binding protein [Coriobacteriia bacterium]
MAARITVDETYCKGCKLCIEVCPKDILALDETKLTPKGYRPATCTDPEACIVCGQCAVICPDVAIMVEEV